MTAVATRSLTADDLVALARGAAVLGTGGGGDPYIGRLIAERAIRRYGPVPLVSLHQLPDDAVVMPVAMMGAPTVMVEKMPSEDQFTLSIDALAKYMGVTPTHLACIEAGGINSTIPVAAAAQLGLPLIDADGMGRAFPEIQMVLPTLAGVRATPMSIADEKGNRGIFDTVDNKWAETLARSATIEMGCSAIISNYLMNGATARESLVPGALSLCSELGRLLAEARRRHTDPVAAAVERLGGRELHAGKVIEVGRRTVTGFARGEAVVEAADGSRLMLHFQNEHLMAVLIAPGGTERVLITTPDLIIVLEAETGEPITTEALRYGHRVRVIGAPADSRWHSPAGIALVGPRYFGYDIDPVRWDANGAVGPDGGEMHR